MNLSETQTVNAIPLATWISLIALAISFVSLVYVISKDKMARRLLASEKIKSLLQRFNDSIRIIDQTKSQISKLSIYWKDCKYLEKDRGKQYIDRFENMRNSMLEMHEKIKALSTKADPVEIVEITFEAEAQLSRLLSTQDYIKDFFELCPQCLEKQKNCENITESDKKNTPPL
jgi:hypothetical protein